MSILVGRKAPEFKVAAVLSDGSIDESFSSKSLEGKPYVLFFWPLDFTFVCPSEIIAHEHRYEEFKKRGVQLIGASIDSAYTHFAWTNTPINNGGIGKLSFPILADVKHELVKAFGIEHPEAGVAFRASFLIDKDGIVRHQTVNDLPIGRNVDEMIRTIDALQFHEEHGEVCPAGWQKGDHGMKASTEGVAEYLSHHANKL